ncbi:hypothetical protein [Roseovarius aquimarinus]|uniref:Uncharacterized protein n=1 Tax=Roseovarius aquimarinus TaxID=1229156 RepID=A0ABW7I528_9RHOB
MGAEGLDISWIGAILRESGTGLAGPATQLWPVLLLASALVGFGLYRAQRLKE